MWDFDINSIDNLSCAHRDGMKYMISHIVEISKNGNLQGNLYTIYIVLKNLMPPPQEQNDNPDHINQP